MVELRQYITYPGKRNALISLFDREFIESQEAVGIKVLGQFRDINDPHHFTWVRDFSSMPQRKQALGDFYSGQLGRSLREQANATLYDNDNDNDDVLLLLRPATPGCGFAQGAAARPAVTATAPHSGFVVVTLCHFQQEVSAEFIARFSRELAPVFERHGAAILGRFVSETSANTFNACRCANMSTCSSGSRALPTAPPTTATMPSWGRMPTGATNCSGRCTRAWRASPETLMLAPAARSTIC